MPSHHPYTPTPIPPPPSTPPNAAAQADQANRVHVATGPQRQTAKAHHPESIKDTLISIVIAFALAFVFRGFVVEAFVIPTGSMAPTLMGAHMRFTSPSTGYSWPVGPWEATGPNEYASVQGGRKGGGESITIHDPISGDLLDRRDVPLQSGDRILVLKYLYSIFDPQRFDVIVFKNPTDPSVNYIKRLIGLPGEEVALVDGDVFARKSVPADPSAPAAPNTWMEPGGGGWTIAQKTPLQQKAVWQTIFDSEFTPPPGLAAPSFKAPWSSADTQAWNLTGSTYTLQGAAVKNAGVGGAGGGRTELFFDQSRQRFASRRYQSIDRFEKWTIDDRYAYDEVPQPGDVQGSFQLAPRYPVSDLRMRAGIEPSAAGVIVEATIRARAHDFQALLEGPTATLRMRPLTGPTGIVGPWQVLATEAIAPLRAGRITNVEFWHADQTLHLWIDGEQVVTHGYNWSPAERILNATGQSLERILNDPRGVRDNPLADPRLYSGREPDVRWAFSGLGGTGTVHLYRVGLDRDLFYQPVIKRGTPGKPRIAGLGTAPSAPLMLNPDQFFACGDNSPQSLDGRLWESIDSWVAYEFDDTIGLVPRELLLGKAFFVYWPSLIKGGKGVPVPDFGRMRFIW